MIDPVAFEAMTAIIPENATIEPTDRSKSRDARQNIMVQATMPIGDHRLQQAEHVALSQEIRNRQRDDREGESEDDDQSLFAEKEFFQRMSSALYLLREGRRHFRNVRQGGRQDPPLVEIRSRDLRSNAAAAHDHDPVGNAHDLRQLAGDDDDRHAAAASS
jgi:hypothetical protein